MSPYTDSLNTLGVSVKKMKNKPGVSGFNHQVKVEAVDETPNEVIKFRHQASKTLQGTESVTMKMLKTNRKLTPILSSGINTFRVNSA